MTHLDNIKLFRLRTVSIPETGQVSTVDPLAVPVIVEVGPDLGPDRLVQLCSVAGDHRSLGQLKQQPPALERVDF